MAQKKVKKSTRKQKPTSKPVSRKIVPHAPKDSHDERVLGMLAHLLAIFSGFIGPLVLLLTNEKKKGLAYDNAKHALNFQISVLIYYVISFILVFVVVGVLMIIALSIFNMVIIIIASVKAYHGEEFKYPLEIPFVKK